MKALFLLAVLVGFLSVAEPAFNKRSQFGLILNSLSLPKSKGTVGKDTNTKASNNKITNTTGKKSKPAASLNSDPPPISGSVGASTNDTDNLSTEKRQQIYETVFQMILSMVSMYVSRTVFKLDFKNTTIRRACRLIFCGYVAFLQFLNWYINYRINFAKDNSIVVESESSNLAALQALGSFGSLFGTPKAKVPVTTMQYDLKEAAKLFGGILPELLVMILVNMIFGKGYILLLLLPMMGITNILKSPIVKIHLFGFRPVGVLKRPFATQWDAMFAAANEKNRQSQTEVAEESTGKVPPLAEVPSSGVKVGHNNRDGSFPTVDEKPVEVDAQDSVSSDRIGDGDEDDDSLDDDDDDNDEISSHTSNENKHVEENTSEEYTSNGESEDHGNEEDEVKGEVTEDGEEEEEDVDSIIDQLDAVVPSQEDQQDEGEDNDAAEDDEGFDPEQEDEIEQLIDELDVDDQ